MLTDTALKNLKPQPKAYKVVDRDGMYVHVATSGSITFRYDYRLHGRRETLTIGKYGPSGLSLARAREKCLDARRSVADGLSPAQEKQRQKRRLLEAKSFGEFGERWFKEAPMADSTRAMRRSIFERDLLPAFRNRLLTEITPDDLRALCAKIKGRGAPATAIHVRDIVKGIYNFANLHGHKVPNPANEVAPTSIASLAASDNTAAPSARLRPAAPTSTIGFLAFFSTSAKESLPAARSTTTSSWTSWPPRRRRSAIATPWAPPRP